MKVNKVFILSKPYFSFLPIYLAIPNLSETTIRKWFSREFNFMSFNCHLYESLKDEDRLIAFAPSYLPKSGKKTEGVGKFWSGCAGAVKNGLEICVNSILPLFSFLRVTLFSPGEDHSLS